MLFQMKTFDKIKEKIEELAKLSGKFAEKAYKEKADSEGAQNGQSSSPEMLLAKKCGRRRF